jgi:hypothetical protein
LAAIQEIEASYGEKAARIVRGWYETQDEIDREIEPVEGPHADLFTVHPTASGGGPHTYGRACAGEG